MEDLFDIKRFNHIKCDNITGLLCLSHLWGHVGFTWVVVLYTLGGLVKILLVISGLENI